VQRVVVGRRGWLRRSCGGATSIGKEKLEGLGLLARRGQVQGESFGGDRSNRAETQARAGFANERWGVVSSWHGGEMQRVKGIG
jgi:hypothetical protein